VCVYNSFVCGHVGVHTRLSMCVHVWVCVSAYSCACVSVCLCTRVCTRVCVSVSAHVHVCACAHMFVYVCVYVFKMLVPRTFECATVPMSSANAHAAVDCGTTPSWPAPTGPARRVRAAFSKAVRVAVFRLKFPSSKTLVACLNDCRGWRERGAPRTVCELRLGSRGPSQSTSKGLFGTEGPEGLGR
jgi:hypothetical protein